ncbi:MAG: GGDEF domain-containing protein [Bdellovibrionales bacterium]
MTKPADFNKDALNDAALSPEQRKAWLAARTRIDDLELRLKILERQPLEEDRTILTRPEFNREVARMLAFDDRYGGTSSVLYFDFEHLDEIGSRYGKAVSNATVRMIGDLLMKNVRSSDIVGRLAPDEFGVLLMRCDNAAAWRKGEQLASLLYEMAGEVHGYKLDIAISYGAYTFRENEDVATGLKEAAHAVTRALKKL